MAAMRFEDGRPTHQQIAAGIRADIMSGDLTPGTQLPSTQELMAQFSVANNTIQKALAVLKSEGYIVGQKGRGVFVREAPQRTIVPASSMPPAPPGAPYWWTRDAAEKGRSGSNRILEVAEVVPPIEVRRAFGLEEDGTAVMRKRVMLLDEEPAELAVSYYPVDLARGTALERTAKIRGGSPTLLADMGYPPREFADRVSCRLPTHEEFLILELPDDMPVLRTFRVVYSDGGVPIEATVMVKAAHLYELEYRMPV